MSPKDGGVAGARKINQVGAMLAGFFVSQGFAEIPRERLGAISPLETALLSSSHIGVFAVMGDGAKMVFEARAIPGAVRGFLPSLLRHLGFDSAPPQVSTGEYGAVTSFWKKEETYEGVAAKIGESWAKVFILGEFPVGFKAVSWNTARKGDLVVMYDVILHGKIGIRSAELSCKPGEMRRNFKAGMVNEQREAFLGGASEEVAMAELEKILSFDPMPRFSGTIDVAIIADVMDRAGLLPGESTDPTPSEQEALVIAPSEPFEAPVSGVAVPV